MGDQHGVVKPEFDEMAGDTSVRKLRNAEVSASPGRWLGAGALALGLAVAPLDLMPTREHPFFLQGNAAFAETKRTHREAVQEVQRLLKMLARADDSDLHASFSINMNVGTLLSPDFLEFDSQLRMGGRGTIVVELHLIDVFSDLAEYTFARDFLREKGYRICLDGVAPASLRFVDRAALGADLIKLTWSEELASDAENGGRLEEFKATVEKSGEARAILCHCNDAAAIRFGQTMGITMYQGRFLDSALHEVARFGTTSALKL